MANVRVEAAAVSVQTTAAGTSPSLAEAASEPTTLALAATCPFIRSILASQDPQAISNTLAPFMALANTTNATSTFAHRARGVAPASRRPPATTPAEPAEPAEPAKPVPSEPIEGKDIVGDDWVMTDLSGADAPTAPIGHAIAIDSVEIAPASPEVPLVDTTMATEAEGITASASPLTTSTPAEAIAASVLTEAVPATHVAPTGREIPVQAPSQTEPEAEGEPSAPAAPDQAPKAMQDAAEEAPEEATRAETAPTAAQPEEAARAETAPTTAQPEEAMGQPAENLPKE